MDDHTYYNKADAANILNHRISEAGGLEEFCRARGLNSLSVADAIKFQLFTARILEAIGLRQVEAYERAIND